MNEDKIRKKGAKYINELVQGEKEARNKRKVSEKRILAISNNERKKKQRIRELLEPYKHGSVSGQYSEQYFDDIGLHRKLFAQVLKNENDEDRVMKRRKYLKDLMELTVELKGHDDVEQKDNVSMVVIKLYNTDLEDLKGILAGHKIIGMRISPSEEGNLETKNRLMSIFGTDNITTFRKKGVVKYIRYELTIGRREA